MKLELPPPVDMGLPEAFAQWRPGQVDAISYAIDSPHRFNGLVLPTGFGKSLVYMAIAALTGWRTVILTSTKALQRQLSHDFATLEGTAVMLGQRNYECLAVQPGRELHNHFGTTNDSAFSLMADQAPCHSGVQCSLMNGGCQYYDAVRAAMQGQVVITNYAWWFTLVMSRKITLRPDLLVLDEAHAAPDALSDAIGATLAHRDVKEFLPVKQFEQPEIHNTGGWVLWAQRSAAYLARLLEGTQAHNREAARQLRRAQTLHRAVQRIAMIDPRLLVVTPQGEDSLRFDVIWAAQYAENWLYRQTPKVLMTSATFTKHTSELIGVIEKNIGMYEAGDGFPVRRRPVYVFPAHDFIMDKWIAVDHRMTPEMERKWLDHIDTILEARRDRKVIIHCVSYRRRDMIIARSKHRERMLTHGKHDTADQIRRFKASEAGTILVSPSVTTGYDFPYDQCEVQIVAKIPFPDGRDPVTKARSLVDKNYGNHVAMQTLVQMAGRGMRASDDQCETFIVDAHARWFLSKHGDLAPKWFRRAVTHVTALPAAPSRLNVNHQTTEAEGNENDD